ncbi:Myosin heavy chain kinase B [Diplonema papillatum]|nr:Myosin heavy chain kinase B [Diplonema papillatum]
MKRVASAPKMKRAASESGMTRAGKDKKDEWTMYDQMIQEGTINARAATVAGKTVQYVWVCERDGSTTVRSCRTGSELHRTTKQGMFPWCLAEGPEKRNVWVGYSSGVIILHSASSPFEQRLTLEAGRQSGGCYCLLTHLNYVFAGYGNCQIIKWNNDTKEREGYYIGHTGGHGSAIRSMCLHLTTLYSSADDMTIRVWDVNTCEQLQVLRGHDASVLSLVYTRANHIWSAGEDAVVKVWRPETAECVKTFKLETPANIVRCIGNRVWCGTWDRKVTIFDATTLDRVGVYTKHAAPLAEIVCVATTKIFKVWTLGTDKCIKVWQTEDRSDVGDRLEFTSMQQSIFDLQSEIDRLNKELGRSRKARSTSVWEIDDVAFCPSEVARDMRGKLMEMTHQRDTLDERATLRRNLVKAIGNRKGTDILHQLLLRYYNRLMQHRAGQFELAKRRAGVRRLDRAMATMRQLRYVNALRKYYARLLRYRGISKKRKSAERTARHLARETRWKLRARYLAKLRQFVGIRRVAEAQAQLEKVSHDRKWLEAQCKQLKARSDDATAAEKKSKTRQEELETAARQFEKNAEEAKEEIADLNQKLLAALEERRLLKDQFKTQPSRTAMLAVARDVFKQLLQAETHTNQYMLSVEQPLPRDQHEKLIRRIQKSIGSVRTKQKDYLETHFTEYERLNGKVPAALYGKAARTGGAATSSENDESDTLARSCPNLSWSNVPERSPTVPARH